MHVEKSQVLPAGGGSPPGCLVLSLLSLWPLNSERSPHPAKKVNEFGDKYLKCG